MVTHVVLLDPPVRGLVLSDLAATTPLSESEAADLYAAMAKDVLRAAERSSGDLIVNYRDGETIPGKRPRGGGPFARGRRPV